MEVAEARFRFYAELNDLLPVRKRKNRVHVYRFYGKNSVKDAIESFDVPHTQVDLILVRQQSVTFDYILRPGDFISVYPVFESLDISGVTRLRPAPLRHPAFVLDVHLGKLARLMRMAGIDTLYRNDYDDREIIDIAQNEKRIILTRDKGILKHRIVTHGHWLHATDPDRQFIEVIRRFDLFHDLMTFSRCIQCNALLKPVKKSDVEKFLKPGTRKCFSDFMQCTGCGRIYWRGSHYEHMSRHLETLIRQAETE
ncbi:MAG: Mut7-C ubiquitin/RNAse domain-containing protein [Bacteroidales bacterium]|nr:Mut7-C ubiquitin/RNAse domain-containing protein [Bacteroidales bacterium]